MSERSQALRRVRETSHFGDRVLLRGLRPDDITDGYVEWINDPEVNRFLSVAGSEQTRESIESYVRSFEGDDTRLLLGIFRSDDGSHIGNMTFSTIDWRRSFAVLGIAIGEKSLWGKGYASEALRLAVRVAFEGLGLHRVEAGVAESNTASRALFERVGFTLEATLRDRELVDGERMDGLIYGLLRDEWSG